MELPLVLPPAVAGLALLATFGQRGLLGGTLDGQFRAEGWIELTLEAVGGKPGEATRAESVSQTLQAMTATRASPLIVNPTASRNRPAVRTTRS